MATAPKTTAPATNPYASIVGGNLRFAGIDQGIDFTGAGPIYALDEGTVTRQVASGSGWPGLGALLSYRLNKGGAAGNNVYVAEDFRAASGIATGSTVHKGQLIGYATGSGQAPGIEIGWADASGRPVAPLPPARPASQYTAEGQSFLDFATGKTGSHLPSATAQSGGGGLLTAPLDLLKKLGGAGAEAVKMAPNAPGGGGVTDLAFGAGAKFLGISLPHRWPIRSAEILGGAVLVLVAIVMLGKSAASSSPATQTRGAVRTVAKAAR